MPSIVVVTRTGAETPVVGEDTGSLMEALRDRAVGDILAMCGGNASCGTCHVLLDPNALSAFPQPSQDERDIIDYLESSSPGSRLACQIRFSELPDGATIVVAPES